MMFETYLSATAVYLRPLSLSERAALARDGLIGVCYVLRETRESADIQYLSTLRMAQIFARQQRLVLHMVH